MSHPEAFGLNNAERIPRRGILDKSTLSPWPSVLGTVLRKEERFSSAFQPSHSGALQRARQMAALQPARAGALQCARQMAGLGTPQIPYCRRQLFANAAVAFSWVGALSCRGFPALSFRKAKIELGIHEQRERKLPRDGPRPARGR